MDVSDRAWLAGCSFASFAHLLHPQNTRARTFCGLPPSLVPSPVSSRLRRRADAVLQPRCSFSTKQLYHRLPTLPSFYSACLQLYRLYHPGFILSSDSRHIQQRWPAAPLIPLHFYIVHSLYLSQLCPRLEFRYSHLSSNAPSFLRFFFASFVFLVCLHSFDVSVYARLFP